MMFRGAYTSDFYRRVRDLLHEQVTLQQSSAAGEIPHDDNAFTALATQWQALIASEHEHRNQDATSPHTTKPTHTIPVPHAAAAQNR